MTSSIVGGRCAGATLATFLARAGASVLALEKDRLASNQIVSTHTIHPPGLDVLDEVGVGNAVRAVAPPMHTARQVTWWALRAAFGGSLAVVPEFIAMARRGSAIQRELSLRRRLLAEAEAAEGDGRE